MSTGTLCTRFLQAIAGCAAVIAAAGCETAVVATAGDALEVRESQEYKLGAGDKVRVTIFDEPTLSGEFQLDRNGAIAMPLIGEVVVASLDARELETAITDELSGRFLVDPKVSAEILTYRPYYLYGEVSRPGEFAYSTDMTVVNAIARAGGFTPRAQEAAVFIRREDGLEEIKYRLTPSLKVYPGDTVRVGARLF